MNNQKLNALSQKDTSTHLYLLSQAEKENELLLIYPENNPLDTNQLVIHFDNSQIDKIEEKIKHLLKTYFKFHIIPKQPDFFIQKLFYDVLVGSGIYIFMTLVIRDPIPLLDEIIFSLAGGYLFHHFFAGSFVAPFLSEKNIENYIKKHPIEFHFSTTLEKTNQLFLHFHEKNARNSISLLENQSFLKNALHSLPEHERIELKKFLEFINRQYHFNKIKPDLLTISKKAKKSIFTPSRFLFYYIAYHSFK